MTKTLVSSLPDPSPITYTTTDKGLNGIAGDADDLSSVGMIPGDTTPNIVDFA